MHSFPEGDVPVVTDCSVSLTEFTPDEILKIVNLISSNAAGNDGLSMKIIRLTLPHSLVAITRNGKLILLNLLKKMLC